MKQLLESLSKGGSCLGNLTLTGLIDRSETPYDSNHSGLNRQRIIRPPWSAS